MLYLAMWSGPRNISTALMRSWGNRADTMVCDEPFYAHYLKETQLAHPGATETLAQHTTDWRQVVEQLCAPLPDGKEIYYQKHMAHHLLPNIGRQWLQQFTHCFLIREPREMLTSLLEFLPSPRVEDTGLPQQVELFQHMVESGGATPLVLEARDVLEDPRAMLSTLCEHLGIGFDEGMLEWPPGPRPSDGAWAPFWYAKVNETTGFGKYRAKPDPVPAELAGVLDACNSLYEFLYQHRMKAKT